MTVEDVARTLGARTRVLSLTWVHSLNGHVVDVEEIGRLCRDNGTLFVINASQAIGARDPGPAIRAADAIVSVGCKWLCGPYGTGFTWLRGTALDRMRVNRRYWLSLLSEADLAGEVVLDRDPPDDATRYDVFATANFFNFVPWVAALEEVAQVGNAACEAHDQDLVECLIHSLDAKRFEVTSPRDRASRSTLVFLQPRGDIDATAIAAFLRHHGVDVAQRAGQLRVSPHVHNTRADIDTLVDLLSTHSAGCA